MFGDPLTLPNGFVACSDGSAVPADIGCPVGTTQIVAAAPASQVPTIFDTLYKVLAIGSAVLSGYHGVKRHNGSIVWGLVWFGLGGLFPVIAPTIAFAQGYAKPMRS